MMAGGGFNCHLRDNCELDLETECDHHHNKEGYQPPHPSRCLNRFLLSVSLCAVFAVGLILIVLLCLLTLWTDRAVSAPHQGGSDRGNSHYNQEIPSWTSPCGQNGVGDVPEVTTWSQLRSLLIEIGHHAHISSLEASHKKKLFLDNKYNDSTSFESLYQQYVHDWLPRPPATQEEFDKNFEEMNVTTAFRKVYGFLQHYAVGLEQATLDQMFTGKGGFDGHFREVQNSLKQLLCEFNMSIKMLRITKDPDVLRDVMSVEQRKPVDALGEHQIMLRDYVILRDFISITEYISELFKRLADHPEKRPRTMQPKKNQESEHRLTNALTRRKQH